MAEHERITDEKVKALQARIGIPTTARADAFNTEAHIDTIRHFAHGYGDSNPLFCAEQYASQSPWEGVIAPPFYCQTLATNSTVTYETPEIAQKMKGDPLRGIHAFHARDEWEFLAPIRSGDRLTFSRLLDDVVVKDSGFANKAAHLAHKITYMRGEQTIATQRSLFIHAERDTAVQAGREKAIELGHYSQDQRDDFDREFAAYERRGARPRRIDDVKLGDEAKPLLKGPLTVTDIVISHIGRGPGGYGIGALDMAYKGRMRMPKLYGLNEFGWWDVAQRCHWDHAYAQSIGAAAAYDYGIMRLWWLGQFVTDWMGDGGWLWKLSCEFRGFNYMGDLTRITGRPTEIVLGPNGASAVQMDLLGANQRGQTTTIGSASVLLPSGEQTRAVLPGKVPAR